MSGFGNRVLPVDAAVAEQWGRMSAIRPVPVVDALLAATARVNGLTLVTRNVADVAGLDVDVLNPFEGPEAALCAEDGSWPLIRPYTSTSGAHHIVCVSGEYGIAGANPGREQDCPAVFRPSGASGKYRGQGSRGTGEE